MEAWIDTLAGMRNRDLRSSTITAIASQNIRSGLKLSRVVRLLFAHHASIDNKKDNKHVRSKP